MTVDSPTSCCRRNLIRLFLRQLANFLSHRNKLAADLEPLVTRQNPGTPKITSCVETRSSEDFRQPLVTSSAAVQIVYGDGDDDDDDGALEDRAHVPDRDFHSFGWKRKPAEISFNRFFVLASLRLKSQTIEI